MRPARSPRAIFRRGCRRPGTNDEVATLGNAFNRMTGRLEEQTGALVTANAQLDSRRAFIEAVLSGVTAGVLSVDEEHVVRLINSSAEALLKTGGESPVGQKLADLAPELDRHLDADEQEDVVQLASRGEPRTLAVKTVQVRRRLCADLRRHHRAIARPAPRRLVGRRPPHRPRDQEPADPDPARRRAASAPLRQGDRQRSRDLRAADRDDRPPGRRPQADGRRILLLRAHAEAGLRGGAARARSPARPCSCTRSRIRKSPSASTCPIPRRCWSATAVCSARR